MLNINAELWQEDFIEPHIWYFENVLGAAFSFLPNGGRIPLEVTFTDESVGDPTSWLWDFGDGDTSTDQNPVHTYNTAGTKTITLTITKGVYTDDTDSDIRLTSIVGFALFKLDLDQRVDNTTLGDEQIVPKFRTKSFGGGDIMAIKRPMNLSVLGKFERQFNVTPYIWMDDDQEAMEYSPLESAFVMGASLMGTKTTEFKDMLEEEVPSSATGHTFSFEFEAPSEDYLFEMTGMEFTYQKFARNL